MKYTISVLVLFSATALSHGDGEKYNDPELHCSFTLPEGWRRLPPSVADRAQALARQAGVPSPTCQAWFQRSDRPEGAYPYLLISRQICRMPTLGELAAGFKQQPQAAAERGSKFKGLVSDSKLFDPVIDNRRSMVTFETEQTVNVNDTGQVSGKCCLFPGKAGVAELFFYTTADNMDRSKADLDFVLSSFAFEPGYEYESGLVPGAPNGFDVSRTLTFVLTGSILGALYYGVFKSRNPSSSPKLLCLRMVFAMLIMLGGFEFLIYPPRGPITLSFVLGSVVVGVVGLAASWVIEMKNPSPPAKGSPNDAPPPA